jgi:hypothetical protein
MARSSWSAGLLTGAIAVVALALVGGGTALAATGPSTSGSGARALPAKELLCARPAAASRVLVGGETTIPWTFTPLPVRVGPITAGRPAAAWLPAPGAPVFRIVTDPATVSSLAGALCALPKMPRGPIFCPFMMPGGFRLTFTADGRALPVVTVNESGCRTVTGLGTVRRAIQPSFWNLLNRIAGPNPVGPISVGPVHLPGGTVAPTGFNPGGVEQPAS